MPRVYEENGYMFFFFSNEGNPHEPCHIHVRKGGALAKYWLEPDVELVDSYGFSASELKYIEKSIEEHSALIEERWNEFFK